MKNRFKRLIKYLSPSESWLHFSVLLLLFITFKGIVYLAILPPFEGWDEYQHIGFIKYLEDHEERPVLNNAFISRNLMEQVMAYPVPQAMLEQVKSTGAAGYKDYFESLPATPVYNPDHDDIRLYQAQHGVTYYKLASLLTSSLSFKERLLDKIFALRLLNLGLTVFTFALIFWFLNRTHDNKRQAALIALLIASQPILILNGCRIANDPLAIATGTIAIVIGLTPFLRKKIMFALIAGAAIGISCWTKSISAVLFPFWFCCLFVAWFDEEITFSRLILLTSAASLTALVVLSHYFRFNLLNYGTLFAMQESLVNSSNSRTIIDVLSAAPPLTIINDLLLKWGEESIWSGGWSFLRIRNVRNIVKVIMIASMLGWVYRHIASGKKTLLSPPRMSLLCLCLVALTSLALTWHYLQSTLAWGHATTNAWYISLSLPFFLVFLANGAYQWSDRIGIGAVVGLTLVYIYSDIRGMITMIHHYSGGAFGAEALQRLASVHPSGLASPVLLGAGAIMLISAGLSLVSVIKTRADYH